MRIRDPVPFRPLDLGWVKNLDPDTGSGIFLTRDPGWKNSEPEETVTITIVFNLASHPELFGHLHLGS